jgi:glutathione S-transferase
VWDSLAIAEFLAERHAGVWPTDAAARTWARCAAAEMHAGFGVLRQMCSMNCGLRVHLHEVTPALQADIDRLDELWQDGLRRFGGPFLAGATFTAVDAFYAPVVTRIQTFGLRLSAPAQAYVAHMLALPSVQQWMGEALHEPWREPAHEAAALQYGVLLADLRTPLV